MSRKIEWDFTRLFNLEIEGGNNAETVIPFTAEVRFHGYEDPGWISGPPENCHPPESRSDFTVESISIPRDSPDYGAAMELAIKTAQEEIDSGLEMPEEN